MSEESMSGNKTPEHYIAKVLEAQSEAKKYRIKKRQAVEELNKLKADYEAAKVKLAEYERAPNELQQLYEATRGELRTLKHKDAFAKVAKELKVRQDALEDVWKLSGYQAETDVPDPNQIKGLLSETVKARPYLVETEPEAPKQLQPGPGLSRGGNAPGTNVFTVRKSDLRSAKWMAQNGAAYAEAHKNGTLNFVED